MTTEPQIDTLPTRLGRAIKKVETPQKISLSDVILGGQDGLVNVLGVILGVAAASSDPRIVIAAGLAATFAESVSMGAVAYTSNLADAALYESERAREYRHIQEIPKLEKNLADEIRILTDERLKRLADEVREKGYAVTIFGRKRPIPEINSDNKMTRSLGERLAVNTPIQGSAADLIKVAMINLDRRLKTEAPDAKMILQVHDELVVEAPVGEAEKIKAVVKEEMENAVMLDVPVKVDVGSGQDWGEAH